MVEDIDIEDITLPRKLSLLLLKMQTLNLDIQDTTEEATVDTVEDIDIEDITLPRKLSLLLLKMQTLNFSLQDIEEVEEATEEATVEDTVEEVTLLERLSLSKTLMSMLLRAAA